MNPLLQCKPTILPLFIAGVLACFGLVPQMRAVVPPPDGGYPGFNTAEGQSALFSLTTGSANTAVGWLSLRSLTEGRFNTAIGAGALLSNIGEVNTATGAGALLFNTTGGNNTANGVLALFNNTMGFNNTACGSGALLTNMIGNGNTATGFHALFSNSTGNANTAMGEDALSSNTTGERNTAMGADALLLSTGNSNTGIGDGALQNNSTGIDNTALGTSAGFNATTGSNNVYIGVGMQGVAGESNACYIASIFGQTSASGTTVVINSDNKLGTTTSSKRFKQEIKPMDKASDALFSLKPVSFRYKKEIDRQGLPQFGLVAEEVEKVNPDLVVRDKEGNPYSVRYDQVNAMLLNEFLKEHKKVEKLEGVVASLAATVKAQAAQIQKVSAQLEVRRPAPQVAENNQ
jgi:trimeric autotransporter adhesin